MNERSERSSANFITRYSRSYPSSIAFKTDTYGNHIEARSSATFQASREQLMRKLLTGTQTKESMSQALMAEHLVSLAIQPLIAEQGFHTMLAPQSLEHGKNQKGIDLIISDNEMMTYLGIDVKLRRGRSIQNRDGYGWNATLKAPYIYLSLGNWSTAMREGEEVNVKDWLADYAVPKIQDSGKIPHLNKLRTYLVARIERSLNGYHERLIDGSMYNHSFGLPELEEDKVILARKLSNMQSVFTELRMNASFLE
jgi:hypothetical protein